MAASREYLIVAFSVSTSHKRLTVREAVHHTDAGAPSHGQAHLLGLPREIQHMIWRRIPYPPESYILPAGRLVKQPPISRVSSEIREDVLLIHYARSHFVFDNRSDRMTSAPGSDTFDKWLESIGEANVKSLRTISFWSQAYHARISLSTARPHTLTLHFDIYPPRYATHGGGYDNLDCAFAAVKMKEDLESVLSRNESEVKDTGFTIDVLKEIRRSAIPHSCIRERTGEHSGFRCEPCSNKIEHYSHDPLGTEPSLEDRDR